MSKTVCTRENPLVDLRNDHVIRLLVELRHAERGPARARRFGNVLSGDVLSGDVLSGCEWWSGLAFEVEGAPIWRVPRFPPPKTQRQPPQLPFKELKHVAIFGSAPACGPCD